MTNRYEDKQAARRERFEELAGKNAELSTAHYQASRRTTEQIPIGQPILVGHHSEGRHRAALKRAESEMRKSCEAQNKAAYYANKAEGVGSGGISSDDPEAVMKLRAELAEMQALQERKKAANRAIRTNKTAEARLAALVALGFSEGDVGRLLQTDCRIGFPSYSLSNNSANMRRVEQRIKELEAAASRENKEEAGAGYTYREDTEENRVMFIFEGKPDEATRQVLKRNGFKWSPSREGKPWVRHLNNAGLYHAKVVREVLDANQGEASA
jgi:Domain of unknown function (DUF3560)